MRDRDIGGIVVSLPPDLGIRLAAEARHLGTAPTALAIELLAIVLAPDAPLLDAVLGPRQPRSTDHFYEGSGL